MMELVYQNERGSVEFGGNGMPWRLVLIDGLGLAPKAFSTVTFPGVPGGTVIGTDVNSRTITFTADLVMQPDAQHRLSEALTIMDVPGVLLVYNGYKFRKIHARCASIHFNNPNGAIQRCVFQLCCDNPFFEDVETSYIPLFETVSYLNRYFSFPGAFSKYISRGEILCLGSVETEPLFRIDVDKIEEGSYPAQAQLVITNHTTGQVVRLDYEPKAGEQIVVDIQNRRIVNNFGDNLIAHISDDTFLDGFHLVPGINDIEVQNYNTDASMTVLCEFTNKYIEAI